MSARPASVYDQGLLLLGDSDLAVKHQLVTEIERLEVQLERLKKHGQYLDSQSLRMYEEMLNSRKNMLESLGCVASGFA